MNESLKRLIEISKRITMTKEQEEKQRRSFAFGSAKIENDNITYEMVNAAANELNKRTTKAHDG